MGSKKRCMQYLENLEERIYAVNTYQNPEAAKTFSNLSTIKNICYNNYTNGDNIFNTLIICSLYNEINSKNIDIDPWFEKNLESIFEQNKAIFEQNPNLRLLNFEELNFIFVVWSEHGYSVEEIFKYEGTLNKLTNFMEDIKKIFGPTLSTLKDELINLSEIIENTMLRREIELLTDLQIRELCIKLYGDELKMEELLSMKRIDIFNKVFKKLNIQIDYTNLKDSLDAKRKMEKKNKTLNISEQISKNSKRIEQLNSLAKEINKLKETKDIKDKKQFEFDSIKSSKSNKYVEMYMYDCSCIQNEIDKLALNINKLKNEILELKDTIYKEKDKFFKTKRTKLSIASLEEKMIVKEKEIINLTHKLKEKTNALNIIKKKLVEAFNNFIDLLNYTYKLKFNLSISLNTSYEEIKDKYIYVTDTISEELITKPRRIFEEARISMQKIWTLVYPNKKFEFENNFNQEILNKENDIEELKKANLFTEKTDSKKAIYLDKAFELMGSDSLPDNEYEDLLAKRNR